MENFKLRPEYLLGNRQLDAEHRAVLEYLDELYQGILAGRGEKQLFSLLEKLEVYFKLHFLMEERLLEEKGCPDLKEHLLEDAMFVRHLERVLAELRESTTTRAVDKVLFLKSWFEEHVQHLAVRHRAMLFSPISGRVRDGVAVPTGGHLAR